MSQKQKGKVGRYRKQGNKVIIEAAIHDLKHLYSDRDPSPLRERDLDIDFVEYIMDSVEEFSLNTPMRIDLIFTEEASKDIDQNIVRHAIKNYFQYEADLVHTKLKRRMRVSRFFLFVGLLALFSCLWIAHLIGSLDSDFPVIQIAVEGFVIIGWVAMWRPLEGFLYDWWPLREERRYLEKVAAMEVEFSSKPQL